MSAKTAVKLYLCVMLVIILAGIAGFAWDISDGTLKDLPFDFFQVKNPGPDKPICSQTIHEDCLKDPLSTVVDPLLKPEPDPAIKSVQNTTSRF